MTGNVGSIPSDLEITAEQVIRRNATDTGWESAESGAGGHVILNSGSAIAVEDNMDFQGAGVIAYDDPGELSTVVEVDFNMHSNEIIAGREVTIPAGVTSVLGGAIVVSGTLNLNGSMVII